ncbi:MAG: hypothetical protein JSW07_18075, partial [bacterium]
GDLFGANPEDPKAIMAAIEKDPEAALKLRKFEIAHKERLQEILLERDKAYLADVQNARQREIEIQKSGGTNLPMYLLAGIVVIGFFLLIAVLMRFAVPEGSREVAYMLFGSLSTSFGMVVSYFFGSSKGSAEKNAMLVKKD